MTRFELIDLLAEDEPRPSRPVGLPAEELGEFWLRGGGRSAIVVSTGRRILPAPADQEEEGGE